jgi:hypothetical protein
MLLLLLSRRRSLSLLSSFLPLYGGIEKEREESDAEEGGGYLYNKLNFDDLRAGEITR